MNLTSEQQLDIVNHLVSLALELNVKSEDLPPEVVDERKRLINKTTELIRMLSNGLDLTSE